MGFGNVVRREGGTFDVFCDLDVIGSGYNVVSKDVDPCNRYDIADVEAYCIEHPECVFDSYNHEFDGEAVKP